MKRFQIIGLGLIALFFVSCEEVIEIDLNESEPAIVIEALLKDVANGNQVIISETGSYFDPGEFPTVSGATVRLIDQEGNEEILQESEPGTYPIVETLAQAGETYTLKVEAENQVFEANSVMQVPFAIDSLEFQERNGPFGVGADDGQLIVIRFEDPVGDDNFLLFEAEINGELQSDLALYDGRQTDGLSARVPFFTLSVESGDSVKLFTYAIDQETYDYYNALVELVGTGFGGGNSATPANPESNWSNGALGFFGTLAVSELEIVVP
ncbi:MAG: DUF4249 domain-containing protein [Bacteroidia bacterium]|nr:DUF4249 domain-containing protein [Bacteroidia bacterium]